MHLLDVRATAGAIWAHGAVPVIEGSSASRSHILYTSGGVDKPLFCDRSKPAARALDDPRATPLSLARMERRFAAPE